MRGNKLAVTPTATAKPQKRTGFAGIERTVKAVADSGDRLLADTEWNVSRVLFIRCRYSDLCIRGLGLSTFG